MNRQCVELDLDDECCKVLMLLYKNKAKYYTPREIFNDYDGNKLWTIDDSELNRQNSETIEKTIIPCLEKLVQKGVVRETKGLYCYSGN